jgi:hypothetical protein
MLIGYVLVVSSPAFVGVGGSRGLQELIAPRNVISYSSSWDALGTYTVSPLSLVIPDITSVDNEILSRPYWLPIDVYLGSISAAKMSQASKRETTREEDMAYSLMGIFDVSMPLLYGEGGRKTFLQMEIFETSEDQSLFFWTFLPSKVNFAAVYLLLTRRTLRTVGIMNRLHLQRFDLSNIRQL